MQIWHCDVIYSAPVGYFPESGQIHPRPDHPLFRYRSKLSLADPGGVPAHPNGIQFFRFRMYVSTKKHGWHRPQWIGAPNRKSWIRN